MVAGVSHKYRACAGSTGRRGLAAYFHWRRSATGPDGAQVGGLRGRRSAGSID